jgi:hypothetical protein
MHFKGFSNESICFWLWQLALMSASTDLKTALSFSLSKEGDGLVFKILCNNVMQRGSDLQWVSMFPTEVPVEYPPLTHLQPTGKTQVVEVNTFRVTVVEVNVTLL